MKKRWADLRNSSGSFEFYGIKKMDHQLQEERIRTPQHVWSERECGQVIRGKFNAKGVSG